jgi:hypothetical protein
MKVVNIKDEQYVMVDDIITGAPIFTKGIDNGRKLVKKRNIDKDNYIFARLKNNRWVMTDGKSLKYDIVLIKKQYIKHIDELKDEDFFEMDCPKVPKSTGFFFYELESVGDCEFDGIFFDSDEVGKKLDIGNIHNNSISEQQKFVRDEDFLYFDDNGEKKIYYTYLGLMKIIFSYPEKNTLHSSIVSEIARNNFNQMIQKKRKEKTENIMGIDASIIGKLFDKNFENVSCIYLFTLGRVKELKDSMSIPSKFDDIQIVCKFGFTKNLLRRINELLSKFKRIKNSHLRLKLCSCIDHNSISKAETDIKTCFKNMNVYVEYNNEQEIVILNDQNIDFIEQQYQLLAKSYDKIHNDASDDSLKLKLLEKDLKIMQLENELLKKELYCGDVKYFPQETNIIVQK